LCETRHNLILRQWDGTDFFAADISGSILCFSREGNTEEDTNVHVVFKPKIHRLYEKKVGGMGRGLYFARPMHPFIEQAGTHYERRRDGFLLLLGYILHSFSLLR
jgi:hypothetical protein